MLNANNNKRVCDDHIPSTTPSGLFHRCLGTCRHGMTIQIL